MLKLIRKITVIELLCLGLFLLYAFFYVKDLSPYWFNPDWTTDDALQQAFPFYSVYQPEIFKDDLIAQKMKNHLPDLHYWLGYLITVFTKDPVMTSHWIMLIQIVLTVFFTFWGIKHAAGLAPAFFGAAWLLHTRPIMQRITGGLPRGWTGVVLAAFICFCLRKNHKAVLLTLLAGCLLHPPVTLIAALAYGLFLIWEYFSAEDKSLSRKQLLSYIALSPFYALITLYVIRQPEQLGQMVDFATASKMPEFQWPDGRFPFLPFPDIYAEIRKWGLNPFFSRLYKPGPFLRIYMPLIVSGLFLLLLLIGFLRRRVVVPSSLLILLVAIFVVYLASRPLAFWLYVPNRHLQFPLALFLISGFSIASWRAFHKDSGNSSSLKVAWGSGLALILLAIFIGAGSGAGRCGKCNFNYWMTKKGGMYHWMRENTKSTALFAGHPTHINALQLFGKRKAFATTETTHPFYPTYYNEIKRRLILSLKAHYALELGELVTLLKPEGIDYFVYSRKRFYPQALKKERLFAPLNSLIDELTSHPASTYAYKQLPRKVDLESTPYMPFRDDESVIIDIKKLSDWTHRD